MAQLKVKNRNLEESAKYLRAAGIVPAVVYHKGRQGVNLSINSIQLSKLYEEAGESSLVDLMFEDGSVKKVLIHEVQRDPVKDKIIHIDFYEVDLKEKLTAAVKLEFIGEAPIVKTSGGVVVKHIDEVEIECLPTDLLHEIKVDLSVLDSFTSVIYVKDLAVPPVVKILNDPEEIVVNVAEPKEEEAEEAAAAAAIPAEGEAAAGTETPSEQTAGAEEKKEGK